MGYHPRVLAYHLILTTYGFWLPNDPRGSWSDYVRAWELLRFGPATKTDERRSLARDAHDRRLRLAAKDALAREPVVFDGRQALAVGRGFEAYAAKSLITIWACSILPSHVHLVIARHLRLSIEAISNQLKGAATRELLARRGCTRSRTNLIRTARCRRHGRGRSGIVIWILKRASYGRSITSSEIR